MNDQAGIVFYLHRACNLYAVAISDDGQYITKCRIAFVFTFAANSVAMSYIEVKFTGLTENISGMLIALLSNQGFDGFEEEKNVLKAFISKDQFDKSSLDAVIRDFHMDYSLNEIPDTNWNKVWESNFEPVAIEDFCAVRADFHHSFPHVKYEIIITPKMSFGTGHHATTWMMIRQMKDMSLNKKTVLDFGTGTGVLAILAKKTGAGKVVAIDNDDWSIANAQENFKRNGAEDIFLLQSDHADQEGMFDVILANITRNVILDNFSFFIDRLSENGILLLSGLLAEDKQLIMDKATGYQLKLDKQMTRDKWISLRFSR